VDENATTESPESDQEEEEAADWNSTSRLNKKFETNPWNYLSSFIIQLLTKNVVFVY
jgi:hypothetical protein